MANPQLKNIQVDGVLYDINVPDGMIGTEQLKDGKVALADNLSSWAERQQMEVTDEWDTPVRTTAGSLSIDTSKGAYILRLITKNAFKASRLEASGVNLLNPSSMVGSAYVFQVPVMLRGSYGVADEANGIIFVDKNGNNLHPDVRFSATYPSSAAAGVAVTPYQFAGHSEYFYPSAAIGYFIVSGIETPADVCARIAWSSGYNQFVAYQAPSSVNLSSIIAAIAATHAAVTDKMLAVGGVSDEAIFGASSALWRRRVSAIAPSWTNEAGAEEGQYIHTATIPSTNGAMKAGGLAEDLAGNVVLTVEGTTVSYTDNNATSNVVVKYELDTIVTGTVSQSNEYAPDDFGIEVMVDADGGFIIETSYFQGFPDTIAGLISLTYKNEADTAAIDMDNMGDAHCKSIDMDELPKVCGYPLFIITDGAPAAAPDFIGQFYIDKTNGKAYMATGASAASDFKALN